MAEGPTNFGTGEPAPVRAPVSWRTHWQVPVFLLAVAVLAGGIVMAVLTAPRPDIGRMLGEADQLLHAEKFQPALELLNKKLLPYYNAGDLTPHQKREFHLLRARVMYLAQQQAGIDLLENAKAIAEEFGEAGREGGEGVGGALEPRDRFYLANVNIALGRFPQAIDLAHGLPAELRTERGKIIKRVVESLLASPEFDAEPTLKLLTEFLGERELTVGDRGWGLARQAELLMKQGLVTSAVTKILQTMPSLMADLEGEQLGELYLLLGHAYFETDALAEAARQLNLASRLLAPTDVKHARAMILLGRIDEQIGEPPEEGRTQARLKYADIAERFAGTPTMLAALLSLGEVDSALGDIPGSLVAYGELVKELVAGKRHPELSAESVTESLMSCASRCFDAGMMDRALDYASLAERLAPADAAPPNVLAIIARAHRSSVESLFQANQTGRERLLELSHLDPATREQARQHLVAAGRYFKRHADRIGIDDNVGYGRSLWMAADCFDQAGDAEQSIPLFADYAKFFPAEQQQPEARFRLAKAYQSRGDYGTAADLYRRLVDDAAQAVGGSGAGSAAPYGDASHVPLAQCYLMDGDPSNDAQAEELLSRVVAGHAGGTGSTQFREALLELGRLRAARGDYARAIEVLQEAAVRFPESNEIDGVRYELADALRHDARGILKTLAEAMPDARRQALELARRERIGRAAELYEEVRKALEARRGPRLSKLEQLQLRNSYFYIGDCEFELKNYERAIRCYDAAREKYSGDPATLVAMVQIVNAYIEQGDAKRAATAQERARRFYDSLPLSVWSDPNLPMNQDDWKRWLESMNSLKPIKEAGAAAGVPASAPPGNDGH